MAEFFKYTEIGQVSPSSFRRRYRFAVKKKNLKTDQIYIIYVCVWRVTTVCVYIMFINTETSISHPKLDLFQVFAKFNSVVMHKLVTLNWKIKKSTPKKLKKIHIFRR